MSIQVDELLSGREVSFSTGAYRTATRTFAVYSDSGQSIDVSEVLSQPGIPDVGEFMVQGEAHPTLPFMTAQEATVQPYAEHKDAFLVTIRYARMKIWGPDSNAVGYMSFTADVQTEFRDVWRTLPNAPTNINNPNDDDIGGTAIDVKGEPVSQAFTTTSFEIEHVIDYPIPFSFLLNMGGRRNSNQWGVFNPNTVLYEGTRTSSVAIGVYRLTHTFHFDSMYHLRQVSVPDFSGSAALNDGSAANYALQAYPVVWRQPFRETYNFSNFGVDEVIPQTG
tara:strand:+ start:2569 stop:3405 length:837 start_codon:yes stop_codon:yes gene_type:complete